MYGRRECSTEGTNQQPIGIAELEKRESWTLFCFLVGLIRLACPDGRAGLAEPVITSSSFKSRSEPV
jgi:hypothetical protein